MSLPKECKDRLSGEAAAHLPPSSAVSGTSIFTTTAWCKEAGCSASVTARLAGQVRDHVYLEKRNNVVYTESGICIKGGPA